MSPELVDLRPLRPSASLDALEAAACVEVRDRVDELASALAPFGLAPGAALRVTFTRSAFDACTRWEQSWRRAAPEPVERARPWPEGDDLASALHRAANSIAGPELAAALREGRRARWRASLAGDLADGHEGPEAAAALHLQWRARHGEERASPWGPLLALWAAGVWPVLLPGNKLVAYVPVRRGDAIVPSPDAPDDPRWPAATEHWLGHPHVARECRMLGASPPAVLGLGPLRTRLYVRTEAPWRFERPVDRDRFVIGRAGSRTAPRGADLAVPSALLSRRHARVEVRADRAWWIVDENSSGGFYREGQRVSAERLVEGRPYRMGDVDVVFFRG